jgi:hypothetical protein
VALFQSKVVSKIRGTWTKRRIEGIDGTPIGVSVAAQFDHRYAVVIKVLKGLFGKISREQAANTPKPIAKPKRPSSTGDFRTVEIAPSSMCCAAAMRATGRPYLLREAPRLPLPACTKPAKCSCRFRKNADRRDSDRRLFGATETNRWFAGVESRKREGRRSAEK